MSDERDRMIETLKEYVVPVLRERGFKGSFPHFRRPTATAIHLLTFQFDKWGGGFTIEIAVCPPDGVTMHWGEHIPARTAVSQGTFQKESRHGHPVPKTLPTQFARMSKVLPIN